MPLLHSVQEEPWKERQPPMTSARAVNKMLLYFQCKNITIFFIVTHLPIAK